MTVRKPRVRKPKCMECLERSTCADAVGDMDKAISAGLSTSALKPLLEKATQAALVVKLNDAETTIKALVDKHLETIVLASMGLQKDPWGHITVKGDSPVGAALSAKSRERATFMADLFLENDVHLFTDSGDFKQLKESLKNDFQSRFQRSFRERVHELFERRVNEAVTTAVATAIKELQDTGQLDAFQRPGVKEQGHSEETAGG